MKKRLLLLSIPLLIASPLVNVKASAIYTVKSGDSLWGIATKNQLSIDKLMKMNKLSSPNIYVGQKLLLSQSSSDTGAKKPVSSADTNVKTYIVKSGDTLYGISRQLNVNVNDLIKWNELKSTTLYVGQKLNLKGSTPPNQNSNQQPDQKPTSNTKVYAIVAGTSSLNLRTSPNGSIITSMPKDTRVEILSTSNGWNQVKYGNIVGWASKSYLNLDKSTTDPQNPNSDQNQKPPSNPIKYMIVNTDVLNLRSTPNGSIITTMPKGSKVQVLGTNGGWTNLNYGNFTGWASSQYLTSTSEVDNSVTTKGKTVILDPGHGGADSGATNGSYYEKYLTMTLANKTKQDLEGMGYKVYLTRTGDNSCLPVYTLTPDLQCRVDKSVSDKADIFVSIHINASLPGAIGTESYYNANNQYDGFENKEPQKSILLAQSIHKRYQPIMGSIDRGVHDCNYYVLRKNTIPATLLEIGFISDYRDLNKMNDVTYQNNISNGIAQGINDYFKNVN